MSEATPAAEIYQKLKNECFDHIKDEKEKELFLKRLIFILVRT